MGGQTGLEVNRGRAQPHSGPVGSRDSAFAYQHPSKKYTSNFVKSFSFYLTMFSRKFRE